MSAYNNTSAAGQARQHNGNNYNYQTNHYPLKQRHSDEKLREQARNRALLQAAAEGQTIRTKKLLKDGADVDHIDQYGWTALHHAAYSGFEDTVDTLLAAGADVNARSGLFGTPLALAALKGRLDVTKTLLASRASLSIPCGKLGSVLHAAFAGANKKLINTLFLRGAELDKVAEFDTNIIDTLLRAQDVGTYLNFDHALKRVYDRSPTLDCEDTTVLLEYDSKIRMPVKDCTTALHMVVHYPEALEVLTSGELHFETFDYFDNLRRLLLYASAFGQVSTLEQLLDYYDRSSPLYYAGFSLVSSAAYAGNHECLKHLLQAGASPYPKSMQGMTALLWAAQNGHLKCVDLLMEHRDPNKDHAHFETHEATPIMDAAENGHLECVKLLLRHNVSLEPLQQPGTNALHCAAVSGNEGIIEELVRAGIDINSLDEHGSTPLECSLFVQKWGYGERFRPLQHVIRKLISLGADPTINDVAQVFETHGHGDKVWWLEKDPPPPPEWVLQMPPPEMS